MLYMNLLCKVVEKKDALKQKDKYDDVLQRCRCDAMISISYQ